MPDGLIRKTYTAALAPADIDEAAFTASPTITTLEPDRDDEVVLPEAILDYLPVYLANPKFLWGHRRDGDPEETMGACMELSPVTDGWKAKFRYDVGINPKAKMVWDQTLAGSQRGYSICFLPVKSVTARSPKSEIEALPLIVQGWLRNGKCKTVYTKVEILEISAVHVPSNRAALLKKVTLEDTAMPKKAVSKSGKVLSEDNHGQMKAAMAHGEGAVRKMVSCMAKVNALCMSAGGDDMMPSDFPSPEVDPDEENDDEPEVEEDSESDDDDAEEDEDKGKSAAAPVVTKKVDRGAVVKHHAVTNDVSARLRAAASSLEGPGYSEFSKENLPHHERVKAVRSVLKSIDGQLEDLLPKTPVKEDSVDSGDTDGTEPQEVAMSIAAPVVTKSVAAVEQPAAQELSAIDYLYDALIANATQLTP